MTGNLFENANDGRNGARRNRASRAIGGRHAVSTDNTNIGWFDGNATPRGADDESRARSRSPQINLAISVICSDLEPAAGCRDSRPCKNHPLMPQVAFHAGTRIIPGLRRTGVSGNVAARSEEHTSELQ